jgi:hypothetical protein
MTATRIASPQLRDRRLLTTGYALGVTGSVLVVIWLGPERMEPALGAVVLAWAALSAMFLPTWRAAGTTLFAAVGGLLLVRNYPGLSVDARLWALGSVGAALLGLRLLPVRGSPFFPFLQLYLTLQLVYVTVAFLVAEPPEPYAPMFTMEVRTTGFRLLAVFTVVLVTAAVVASRLLWDRAPSIAHPERPLLRAALPRAWILLGGSLAAAIVLRITGIESSLGSLNTLVRLVAAGGGALLALLWLQRRLPRVHQVALVGIALVAMVSGLGSGFLYQSALPALILFALLVAHRRQIPWLLLLVAAAGLVVLNVSKTEFRTERNTIGLEGTSTELGLTYLDRVIGETSSLDEKTWANSAYRFANLSDQLGYFATWVPDRYPYYGYKTYLNMPRVVIPRFLDPSKPVYDAANEVGRRYEIIHPFDFETAVNPSPPAEAYVAGGWRVMVGVGAAIGVFLVLLGHLFRSPRLPVLLTGVLLSYQVMSTLESGVLSLFLTIPFALLLYPVMRWACLEQAGQRTAR